MMKLYLVLATIEQDERIYYKWNLYNDDEELIFQSRNAVIKDDLKSTIKVFIDILFCVNKLSNDIELNLWTNLEFISNYFYRNRIVKKLHYDDFELMEILRNAMKGITPSKLRESNEVKFLKASHDALLKQVEQSLKPVKTDG